MENQSNRQESSSSNITRQRIDSEIENLHLMVEERKEILLRQLDKIEIEKERKQLALDNILKCKRHVSDNLMNKDFSLLKDSVHKDFDDKIEQITQELSDSEIHFEPKNLNAASNCIMTLGEIKTSKEKRNSHIKQDSEFNSDDSVFDNVNTKFPKEDESGNLGGQIVKQITGFETLRPSLIRRILAEIIDLLFIIIITSLFIDENILIDLFIYYMFHVLLLTFTGTTIGKCIAGLKVVKRTQVVSHFGKSTIIVKPGQPIGFKTALKRTLVKYLYYIAIMTPCTFFCLFNSKYGINFYDDVTGTFVVYKRTLWKPAYD